MEGWAAFLLRAKITNALHAAESNKRSCYGVEQLLKERRLGLAEVGRRTFCKDHTVSVVDNAQTCLSACIFIMGQVRCVGFPKACELETTKTSSFMAPVHQCFELRESIRSATGSGLPVG